MTLSDYITYFEGISQSHKNIKSFVFGNADIFEGESRASIEYNCLWLETPSMTIDDKESDNTEGIWRGAFVILKNAKLSLKDQRDVWIATEKIALDVLAKMKKDRRKMKFRVDFNSVKIDPITQLFVDNDYGWRVEFSMESNIDICYDADVWGKILVDPENIPVTDPETGGNISSPN